MDADRIDSLLDLARDALALGGAKQIAGSIVNHSPINQHNTCAATLSCLLDFAGIYVGIREEVIDLAPYLEHERNWARITIGSPMANGDVGVYIGAEMHHIYTVIDATDQQNPMIADNQGTGAHRRPIAGGEMAGIANVASPTSYFLRAS
jgi:hypothetical protein